MVVPHRVVQAERLVAAAPLVAGPGVLVDDQRRYAELPQPGAQRDPALAAADHEHERLCRDAELGLLGLAALEPGGAVLVGAVLGSERAGRTAGLLVALELVEGGEEGPRLEVAVLLDEPEQPAAAADRGLEAEPGRDHAVGLSRRLLGRERGRVGGRQGAGQQAGHAVGVLDRGDVPRERHQVAPEARGCEHAGRPFDVAVPQGRLERREPRVRPLLRGRLRCLHWVVKGLGHDVSFAYAV